MAALVLTLLIALALHGTWRLFRLPSPWPRLFLASVARIIGAHVRVRGTPLRRDVVFVSNHVSWTDILVLAGTTGTAFVAAAELRRIPLIGWMCTLNRTIFIAREDRAAVTEQIATVRDALAGGRPVTIFPEGTTADGVTLLPFKATLLEVLDPAPPKIRVQPVRIDYGPATPEIAWIGDETGQDHVLCLLRRSGTFIATLRFREPFDPDRFSGRKAITAEARRRIEAVD